MAGLSSKIWHPLNGCRFCWFRDPWRGLRVKKCVWLGVSQGLDLAFLNAD